MRSVLILFITFVICLQCSPKKDTQGSTSVEREDRLELHHSTIGSGSAMIIMHGGPGLGSAYLEEHLSELGKQHQVIFYDQRNSGRSPLVEDSTKISLDHFLKDIDDIRSFYKLEKVHLLAHSWGGLLAMNYAHQYPDKVDKMILINSLSGDSKINEQANTKLANRFSADDLEARSRIMQTEAFKNQNAKAYDELMMLGFEYQFSDATKINRLHLDLPDDFVRKSALLGHLYKDLYTYNFTEELKNITAPTLLLYGLDDPVTPYALNSLSSTLPNFTIKAIEDAGHFPFIEKPEQTIDHINTFLK